MAVEVKLVGHKRTVSGSLACRKLRRQGQIPGNVYGHKEANEAISVSREGIAAVLASGHRVIDLDLDGKSETTMIRELQWDTFGKEVYHVDLQRIDPNERIELDVPLELRGQAPGTMKGGHIEQPVREVTIECLVIQVPDSIVVRIGNLEVGGSVYGRDLELPEGVKLITPEDLLLLHCVAASTGAADESAAAEAEPELIRKPTDKADSE